jgi:CheY-like chemotaxis protein
LQPAWNSDVYQWRRHLVCARPIPLVFRSDGTLSITEVSSVPKSTRNTGTRSVVSLDARRRTIVIADDHAQFREEIQEMLNAKFDIVGTADDGASAVAVATRLEPEIVLLDICMPILDGFKAARLLRANGCRSKIVFLSVHNDSDYIEGARDSGADGYVVKSRVCDDLEAVLGRVLQGEEFVTPLP